MVSKKKIFGRFVGWNCLLNDLQFWMIFFAKTQKKNTYRELFLCKSINQTAFWDTFLVFSIAFICETNCLIAFLIGTRSFAQIFQTRLFFFSSGNSFCCKQFSRSSYINFALNKFPIPNKNNYVDLHRAILRHGWNNVSILF